MRRTTALIPLIHLLLWSGCSQNQFPPSQAGPPAPAEVRVAEPLSDEGEASFEAGTPPEGTSRVMHGEVSLPPELEDRLTPQAVLYVIARDSDASKNMPLAAQKHPSPSFPLHFDLTDADSLTSEPLPASFEVILRLDADGDLGTSGPSDLTAGPVPASPGESVRLALQEESR